MSIHWNPSAHPDAGAPHPRRNIPRRVFARAAWLGLLGLGLCAAAGVAAPLRGAGGAPSARPERHTGGPGRRYTIEQFMATTSMTGASITWDDRNVVFSSNASGIFNVCTIPVAGGEPTALTHSTTDNNFAVSAFPHDSRVLYTRDAGGNELNHLYVLDAAGAERDLTPGDSLKAQFIDWTPVGDAFYLSTNERDARFFDIYRMDATSYARTLIYQDDVGLDLGAISPDGRWLAFQKANGTADTDIYLGQAGAGAPQCITTHTGSVQYAPADFDPTNHWLYFLTNDGGGEFTRVCRYEVTSGAKQEVESAPWDVASTNFSRQGAYRVSMVNADGRTEIRLVDVRTGQPVPLPELPGGDITQLRFSPGETLLAFFVNGDRQPNDLYVWRIGDRTARRLTHSLSPEIDPEDLVDARVVRFKSFDGLLIPNILYRPRDAGTGHRAPAIVYVHGGPGGQTRRGYSAFIQYLVNHGYVVLGINNRGSSGYGQTFFRADDQKHGHEPLEDCVAAKAWLAAQPDVDPQKIGILGGSYGGYMVLAALAFKPQEFAVGVDLFGVSNWVRTLESIPPYWEAQRRALYEEIGDPTTQGQMLRDISPLFHTDQIQKPLMVLQGANDPRVIKPESDDIVAAVKKAGVPVEYVVFADEGHGFQKKKNQIDGYGAILRFLDHYLKREPGPTP